MERKLAIVLNGGGARASYQVGALRAIYEIIKSDQKLFNIITGNSAGAINAAYLASGAEDWGSATQSLVDLWKRIKPEDVYDLTQFSMAKMGTRWMKEAFFKGNTAPLNGLLDTTPLRNLLEREIDFQKIHEHIVDKNLSSISLSTTNYFSSSSVVFFDGDQRTDIWAKSDRFAIKTQINIDHVMASAAIPLFFPPAKIDDSYFGDGCIRQITPLSPSINLGAKKIVTIDIRHQQPIERMKELTLKKNSIPQLSQIGGVVMNAIFLDSLESDVERLEKINTIVEMMGPKSPWKYIPILYLRPSRDLGAMTEKLNKQMPTVLRYFLRGIGVSGKSGLDLLSYLAFDSSYTLQVAELGYEDTMAKKKLILNFIES